MKSISIVMAALFGFAALNAAHAEEIAATSQQNDNPQRLASADPIAGARPAPQIDLEATSVDPQRAVLFDRARFRVIWDGQRIEQVRHVSGISQTTEVVTRWSGDGSATRMSPGRTTPAPITMTS